MADKEWIIAASRVARCGGRLGVRALFVAQAHSFRQQARLAITLAWVAGYTNVVAVLACGHAVSHVSGTTSELGRQVVEALRGAGGGWGVVWFGSLLIGAFLVGAMISGVATEIGRRRGWASIYVLPMAIQSVMLGAFAIGLRWLALTGSAGVLTGSALAIVAAMAMGLQNATITRISSGVVRTTHVTGVVTDMGLELVGILWPRKGEGGRGDRSGVRRVLLLTSILGSFALGAALGTLAYASFAAWAMYVPVVFLAWIVFQDLSRPIAEIEASARGGGRDLMLPAGMFVFHVRPDRDRGRGAQRLPNLRSWSERLPAEARVVILDLTGVDHLNANAAYELRAALEVIGGRGGRMVVAGVTPGLYGELRRAGAGEFLSPESVCPDLELAIARGIVMLG